MTNLSEIQAALAPHLERMNKFIKSSLHSDSDLMNSIVDNYLKRSGKQLRPIMVLLSAKLRGEVNDNVLYAGAAIELLHNASLIHDDVIDQARQRRGVDTINHVWNNHIAVLVGDFFVSRALVCGVNSNSPIMQILANLGADLSLGEVDQFDTARNHTITEDNYFDIISKKTASLFTSCVEVGALASGAAWNSEQMQAIKRYAQLLGLCFQIKDDTFDYFHDPVVGKPTGNDLREGKVTLPLIYALSRRDDDRHAEMVALVGKTLLTTQEIDTLITWAIDSGGIDYAYLTMHRLRNEAQQLLAQAFEPGEVTEMLDQIFAYIISRDK